MSWKQVDQIFQQALKQPPEKRKSFLDEACAGDPWLRLEIDRLLSCRPEEQSCPEDPDPDATAKDLTGDPRDSPAADLGGRWLSHYRLLEKVGEGGMGVVYLAHDDHLQRSVAIKVLPPGRLDNQSARKRFRKEALALSKLNHPNIGTIYDFDTRDEIDFLVMEYLQGQTLGERLASGPLPANEIARLGEQLADGLDSAHGQGIIHCDLKPGNLIIVAGGRLKILDFGLARLLRVTSDTPSLQSLSETQAAGGTVPYMSPEQLRGGTVDARSDLFSFGAVLYEMATGHRAFEGNTPAVVSDAILRGSPAAPSRLNPDVPAELERIILKALEKDPHNRYQSAREILADLRRWRQDSVAPDGEDGGGRRFWTLKSSAAVFLAGILFLTLALLWFRPSNSALPERIPFPVTGSGSWAGEPEISPSGNQIVYSASMSGSRDIWLTDLKGNPPKQLTDDPATDSSAVWFPDENRIAFVKDQGASLGIWMMNVSDRQDKLIVPDARDPAISPDGKRIAFARPSTAGYLRIGVASVDNPGEVSQLTDDKGGLWDHKGPAWSPDGKMICYSSRHGLWVVSAAGGPARPLTSDYDLDFDPVWSHKSPYIYFSSYRGGTLAIWRVRFSGGQPERVTMGTGPESHPSLPWDSSCLVHANGMQNQECVLLDRGSGKSRIVGTSDSDYIPSIAADGTRIVFVSRQGGVGSLNLWIQGVAEDRPPGPPQPLTRYTDRATFPALSPDGAWVAFYRIIREQRDIWIVSSSGGEAFQFTDHPAPDMYPAWSPDGSMLAFSSQRTGGCDIWTAKVKDGRRLGPERQVTTGPVLAHMPAWSSDGSIAFSGELGGHSEAYVVPAQGGSQPARITDGADVRRVRWDPISGDVLVSATWGTDRLSLWSVSPRDKSYRLFTPRVEFGERSALFGFFDISRDGQFLIFARSGGAKGQIWSLKARKGVF